MPDVLDKLQSKLYIDIVENGAYYASIKENDAWGQYELSRVRLWALIDKLACRSKPLARLIYLQNAPLLDRTLINSSTGLTPYLPKRGKKRKGDLPIKYIMKAMGCSRRTAQTYSLAMQGLAMADEILNKGMVAWTAKKRAG